MQSTTCQDYHWNKGTFYAGRRPVGEMRFSSVDQVWRFFPVGRSRLGLAISACVDDQKWSADLKSSVSRAAFDVKVAPAAAATA